MGGQTYFADLHIHIGRTWKGQPVKITASPTLTLTHVLEEASTRKGMDIVGVIDCHSPEVLAELSFLIEQERAVELPGGGIRFGSTTLLPGAEVEINDASCQGPIHVLCYMPNLETMSAFSQWLSRHQKNIQLSSQRCYVTARELQRHVQMLEGLFIPAHIFTPYKSLYGKGVIASMTEILDPEAVDAVELGLSSNTMMADTITELHPFTFVSNSDAHSLPKIGREYQMLALNEPDFKHVRFALKGQQGQHIVANYGLDPLLGKYHQDVVARLEQLLNRRRELGMDTEAGADDAQHAYARPPYVHQIPLEFIPGVSTNKLRQLIDVYGSEMNVIHASDQAGLEQYIKPEAARLIIQARAGQAPLTAGGAGKYGKVAYPGQA